MACTLITSNSKTSGQVVRSQAAMTAAQNIAVARCITAVAFPCMLSRSMHRAALVGNAQPEGQTDWAIDKSRQRLCWPAVTGS